MNVTSQRSDNAIFDQIGNAIAEEAAKFTVVIDVSKAVKNPSNQLPSSGTGIFIKTEQSGLARFFIVTCKHVLKDIIDSGKIGYIFHSKGSLISMDKKFVQNYPLAKVEKSYTKELKTIAIYKAERDDLAILEVDKGSLAKEKSFAYHFTGSDINSPEAGTEVVLFGFASELQKKVTSYNEFGAAAYLDNPIIIKKSECDFDLGMSYNPSRHLLLYSPRTENSVNAGGLSGCGVWIYSKLKKGKIWAPFLRLVGIQHEWYPSKYILRSIRINRLKIFMKKHRLF